MRRAARPCCTRSRGRRARTRRRSSRTRSSDERMSAQPSFEELRSRVRVAAQAEQQLRFLREQVERLAPLLAEREEAVRVEDRDVEDLGDLSLDNLLLRLIGGMESSLERERREAVAARVA